MTRKMTEEISPSLQGSKTKLKFTFSTRILNLTFLEKRNKKNQTKWRLHTKKKKEESSPGWATKITKISVSLQKELATIGSSRDNSRADASRSWTIQENQARSIPSKNRSGSILALLSGASRVPRVSASSRGGPTTMGGWKRDRGTRHGLVLLGYLAERPTMTATSHHHSLDQRWTTPGRVTCAPSGMCMIALSKKGGQPASVEHLHVLEDIFGLVQWLGRSWF